MAHTFFNGDWFPVLSEVGMEWNSDSSAEALIEFAGRNCYQSFANPGKKTNKEYIANIIDHGHGSVLEHASCTFFITGVSRSLTHELIRHRHLSFSELSQRYVDVEDSDFIKPPAFEADPILDREFLAAMDGARTEYRRCMTRLEVHFKTLENGTERRKKAREAARCVMPNCTETKVVMSGNLRAIRHLIETRGSEHADAEIRQLAVRICEIMKDRFPNVFGDFEIVTSACGHKEVRTPYPKV